MGIQGSKQDQELEFIQETATGLGLAQDSLESKVCLLPEVTQIQTQFSLNFSLGWFSLKAAKLNCVYVGVCVHLNGSN